MKPKTWTITLNEYQRANLLWLFELIGYTYGKGVEPFTYANTGDWVGEIPLMLDMDNDREHQPNVDRETIEKRIQDSLKAKLTIDLIRTK